MIPVVIWGAGGRMGQRLIRLIQLAADLEIVGAVETDGHPGVHQDSGQYHNLPKTNVPLTLAPPDRIPLHGVVIDFSLTNGLEKAAAWALENQWYLVSGTTALSDTDRLTLAAAAEVIPVLHAPNFSIGIQLLLNLVSKVSNVLPGQFDCTIFETHHNKKKDKPSGTALAFKNRVEQGIQERNLDVAAVRGGNIVGEHSIRFVSELEDITLSHSALNRDVFAAGALDVSRWIRKQKPGLYTLADMLELN